MDSDTICAVATPPGEGSLGVIRVSGTNAVQIVEQIFRAKNQIGLRAAPSHHLTLGTIRDPFSGKTLDEACCVVMRAPHSYTGEDVVELSAHGNPRLLARIMEVLFRLGARLAQRGEFTKRAFLNGKIDLTQAEGVMDTIRAVTAEGLDLAVDELQGKLGKHLKGIRQNLLAIMAPIEACIDFPEEEVPEVSREKLIEEIEMARKQVAELLGSASSGRIYMEGLSAVIAGKPNAGKSSLLNALLREGRAIVTDIPGTTRDTIEALANIHGIPVRLIDTAGIRSTEDTVEKLGILRSREALAQGDLLLLVLDRSVPLETHDVELLEIAKKKKSIVVLNKMDVSGPVSVGDVEKLYSGPIAPLSIKENQGIDFLEEKMSRLVLDGGIQSNDFPKISRLRHQECLEKTNDFLLKAIETLREKIPLDLACMDVRGAAQTIGDITGEHYTDDLLDKIFSEFCVGK